MANGPSLLAPSRLHRVQVGVEYLHPGLLQNPHDMLREPYRCQPVCAFLIVATRRPVHRGASIAVLCMKHGKQPYFYCGLHARTKTTENPQTHLGTDVCSGSKEDVHGLVVLQEGAD